MSEKVDTIPDAVHSCPMPKADFKDKQIEKLQTAIAKLEGQSGSAQEKARAKAEASVKKAGLAHRQKIDVLEKQLKALGGSR